MTTRPTARSPQPSAARDGIDDGAMLAIRSVLHDQKPDVHATGAAAGRVDIHEHAKLAETTTDRPRKRGSVEQSRPKNKLIERILGHKHALKGVILVGTLLILYTRPWLIIGMIFLTICSCVGLFVALGYDRFWRRAVALGRWYAKRKPARAVELHRKLDAFAMKWDAILDRFPEGSVDGLYLPDFGEIAQADTRHAEAMDRRLSRMDGAQG
jgi:hypothetical protein